MMPKWEYDWRVFGCTDAIPPSPRYIYDRYDSNKNWESEMQLLGMRGWENYAVVSVGDSFSRFYFKRQVA